MYIIIPDFILKDKNLIANEKLLFGLIYHLSYKHGYCFASNSFLSDILNVSKVTLKRYIKTLLTNNYIKVDIINNSLNSNKRKIYINEEVILKMKTCNVKNDTTSSIKNEKYNKINNINKRNNIVPDWLDKKIEKIPPTEEQKKEMEAILEKFR